MLTFPPIPTYIFFCPGYFTSFEEESRFHAADLQKAKRVKMFLCVFVVDRESCDRESCEILYPLCHLVILRMMLDLRNELQEILYVL